MDWSNRSGAGGKGIPVSPSLHLSPHQALYGWEETGVVVWDDSQFLQ